jgi:hypothetical protein
MMHRIRADREGNLRFTEMMTDKLGKVFLAWCFDVYAPAGNDSIIVVPCPENEFI